MLACSCLVPDGWVNVPVPEEQYDFNNPTVFLPLIVYMAPHGAVVFTIAARPAFEDGSVQDWAEYLAGQNNLQIERIREARVNRMPRIVVDATMPSEAGLMRSRSVFLEDGGRLFNIGTLAPDAIWPSVEADFDRLLGAFALDEVRGITAVPLRLMTSEPAVGRGAGDPRGGRSHRRVFVRRAHVRGALCEAPARGPDRRRRSGARAGDPVAARVRGRRHEWRRRCCAVARARPAHCGAWRGRRSMNAAMPR